MTKEELKEKLLNAKAPDWLDQLEITSNFPIVDFRITQKGFSSIYLLVEKHHNGWEKIRKDLPSVLETSRSHFETIFNQLNTFVSYIPTYEANQLSSYWANHIAAYFNRTSALLTYDCPETQFLIKLNQEQPDLVKGAFEFLSYKINGQNIQPNIPQNLTAYIAAYEFVQRDYTKLTERRDAEKSSLSRLRNEFAKYLGTSENQLNTFLTDTKQKSEELAKEIVEIRDNKEILFTTWFNEVQDKHQTFVDESHKTKIDLEKTYQEHLRLKGPADYWKKRALQLQGQSRRYMFWLIALVVFSAGLLYILLGTMSNGALEVLFKDTGRAIKWSIILISFISFMAYGVKLLAKASFSALHLARDAEEREHLTYLYLSLRKDGNVEDEDRQLILQSLFSRADTGLLKEDSSPSMPGSATGIVEKAIFNK